MHRILKTAKRLNEEWLEDHLHDDSKMFAEEKQKK